MPVTPPAPPPPPRLGWNAWDELDVPDLGTWQPTHRVTVVMPYYQAPDALRRTLAAMTAQTYPRELLQVVVVDDGSDPPLALPDDLDLAGLRVDVVHQEDRGFGLARARNTGAKAADGEILVFVDCDMVPEPWHVEAHARWHHVADDLVVLGFRRHVEFDGIDEKALAAVDPGDGLAPLFADRDVQVPTWIDAHMERTEQLRSAADDLFRPLTGGNLSLRADTYWRVGGSDESFTQWGAEDTELGFRLFVDGAVLVPDRQARCWHQGQGHEPSEAEKASLDQQRARLAHLVAHRGFRSRRPGRQFQVPRVAAHVATTVDDPRDAVVATVESLLGGRFTDLVVLLEVAPDHPDATWLGRQFAPDPRVRVCADVDLDEAVPHTPVRLRLAAGVTCGDATVDDLVTALESPERPVGRIRVVGPAPGGAAPPVLLDAVLTRAERRARRAAGDTTADPLVADLFGERWVTGDEVDVAPPQPATATPPDEDEAQAAPPPPAPRVPGNRWDRLDEVPTLGAWTPTRPVTVVMPHYQAPDAVAVTLAALARQTYPTELLQVIVVDDGSDPPLVLPDDLDVGELDVTVLHQPDRGFGAPRARNLGARHAAGEVLVFLDCDMVPEPWLVEAHARWHHVAADLAVLGFRRHVDFSGITPDTLADLDPVRGIAPLVADRPHDVPEWVEGHMVRTDDLRSADRDLFRPVASGNLSVRAEQFWRVGGFDETFTQWGGEDTELGYRLFTDGAVLVPDRQAACWHQGAGHEPSDDEWASLEVQRAKLAHLIADRGFRSSRPGRRFTVPRVALRVPVGADTGRDAVVATTESLLGGSFTDVLVVLQVPDDHPDRPWLDRQFGPDAKVLLREPGGFSSLDRDARHAPIRGTVDPGVVVGPGTLAELVAVLESSEQPCGLVHVTVPGRSPEDPDGMVQVWLTRAHRRASRLTGPGQPMAPVVGELFGERWLAGSDLGIRDRSVDAPGGTTKSASVAEAATMDEISDLWQVFRTLDPGEREAIVASARTVFDVLGPTQRKLLLRLGKRLVLLATALRGLLGARSASAVLGGTSHVLEALLPWAVYRPVRDAARPIARRLRARGP